MTAANVCPSTLAEGYTDYSPKARQVLFDGREVSPYLEIPNPSDDSPEAKQAVKSIGRISLSGAQPKFSAVVGENDRLRLTHEGEQGTYIIKPCPTGLQLLCKNECAANEHLTMQIASQVYGIKTAANALCFFKDGKPAYVTRRFDVFPDGRHSQEDFAALMGVSTANGGSDYKYVNGSYEECAEVIRKHVKAFAVDILIFFRQVLYNFISSNSDAHLKNFSLLDVGGEYRLSPAYDLINTSLHLYEPTIFALDKGLFREGMTFSDVRTIKRSDFEEFGRRIGLPSKIVITELNRFAAEDRLADSLVARSYLSEEMKTLYLQTANYRCQMLRP